jgi:hypothetical protein
LRQLAPEKVPASCESCQPAEALAPANLAAWDLSTRFAGLFAANPVNGRISVDYAATRWIATEEAVADPLWLVEQLEAVARGINAARR